MKILHIADVHLGRGFSDYENVSETLSEARYETLERLVGLAQEKQCDMIAIAGDLFERVSMKKSDVVRAIQILNGFERGPVLLLPGNHDYYTSDSKLWKYVDDAREDHVIVLTEERVYMLDDFDLDVSIYPAPCHSKHSSENTIGWVKDIEKSKGRHHIGIAHGSVPGVAPDFNDEHYPMTKEELNEAGVDLWLLGHIHVPWPNQPGTRDGILYSGTSEPDKGNCPHKGTALLIDIDDNKNRTVELLETGQYRFTRESIELTDSESFDTFEASLADEENKCTVCRLKVHGRLTPELHDRWVQELLPKVREAYLYLKLDDEELKKKITKKQIKDEFPKESFPEKLLSDLIQDDDEDALQIAYELIEEVRDEN